MEHCTLIPPVTVGESQTVQRALTTVTKGAEASPKLTVKMRAAFFCQHGVTREEGASTEESRYHQTGL